MYIQEDAKRYIDTISDVFKEFPYAIPKFIEFYYDELQEGCPDLTGKTIGQIVNGKKSIVIAMEYIQREDDLWEFIERFEDDIKADYDCIEYGNDDNNEYMVIKLLTIHVEDGEDFIDFITKSYKELKDKPSMIEIINHLTEKML